MLCLAVVGLPGAGKSEFLRLAVENGFAGLEWSDVLAADLELEARSRQEMHKAAALLVQSKGVSYYPKKIFELLCSSHGIGHIVSGVRNPRELECLLRYYSVSRVVWISSHYLARFSRCAERQKMDKTLNLQEFIREDMYELAHGLAEIGCSLTDDLLFNDGDLEMFKRSVLTYLARYSGNEWSLNE